MVPEDNKPHEGSRSRYTMGCRCNECRTAHVKVQNLLNEIRRLRLKEDPTIVPHGRASTYSNWGCRCKACCHAASEKRMKK